MFAMTQHPPHGIPGRSSWLVRGPQRVGRPVLRLLSIRLGRDDGDLRRDDAGWSPLGSPSCGGRGVTVRAGYGVQLARSHARRPKAASARRRRARPVIFVGYVLGSGGSSPCCSRRRGLSPGPSRQAACPVAAAPPGPRAVGRLRRVFFLTSPGRADPSPPAHCNLLTPGGILRRKTPDSRS